MLYFTNYSPFPLNEQVSFYDSLGRPLSTTQCINDPSTVDVNTSIPVHYDLTSLDDFIYDHDNATPIDYSGYYQTSSGTALYEDTTTASSPSDSDMDDFSIPANYGDTYSPSSLKEVSYENAITIVSSTSDSDMSVDHYNLPINYGPGDSPSSCSATSYSYMKVVAPSTCDSDTDTSYLPNSHSSVVPSSLPSYDYTPGVVSSACDYDMDDLSIPNISQFSLSRAPSTAPTADVALMPHGDTQSPYLPSSSSVLDREDSPPTEDPGLVSDHGSDSDDTASDYVPSRQPSPKPVHPKKQSTKKSTGKSPRKARRKASSSTKITSSGTKSKQAKKQVKGKRFARRNNQAKTPEEIILALTIVAHYKKYAPYCPFPGCNYNKKDRSGVRDPDFKRHVLTHVPDSLRDDKESPLCPFCDDKEPTTFSRHDALLRHIRKTHPC